MEKFLKIVGWVLGSLVAVLVILSALFAYWYLRPNRAHVDTGVVTDSWDIANDGMHNSNTDMIEWQGKFYISYVSSPFHFGSVKSVLHVKVSTDLGHKWLEVNSFSPYGEDIRDPKFAVIGDRLFLYALKNTFFVAEAYITVYSTRRTGRVGRPSPQSLDWMAGCFGDPRRRMVSPSTMPLTGFSMTDLSC